MQHKAPRQVLVIDVETTGQNRFQHWMPCFAAALVDEHGQCPADAQFLCYLEQPPDTGWDEACLRNFWRCKRKAVGGQLLVDRLHADAEQHGRWEPALAMGRFVAWLERVARRWPKLQIASDNAAYDIGWLDHYLQRYCPKAPSMAYCTGEWRPILDVRSFAAGKGATLRAAPRDHNPLHDAIQIGQEYIDLLKPKKT